MKRPMCRFAFIIVALAFVSALIACSNGDNNTANVSTASPPPTVSITWKQNVTANDISRIKWLEGTWKGTAEGHEPFYERYRFEGTTMYEDSFEDGTLNTIKDTARYALINGEFRHTENGRRTAASEIADDHIQFIPVVGDGNSYRFERQPGGKWRAVLEWPANGDQPAKQVIYNMEPYKK
jgi:hypothetical protein